MMIFVLGFDMFMATLNIWLIRRKFDPTEISLIGWRR